MIFPTVNVSIIFLTVLMAAIRMAFPNVISPDQDEGSQPGALSRTAS